MDHPCYQCGQTIEDGKPFCLHCGAPQIRVTMPEPLPSSVAGSVSGRDAAFSLGPTAMDPPAIPSFRAPVLSTSVDWRRAFWLCAAAALVAVVGTSLRLIGPLIAILASGCLAVILYYRRPGPVASALTGARIGAVTGLLYSGVLGLFFAIFVVILQAGGELRQQLLESLQQFASRSNDPNVQATFDLLKTQEGLNKLIVGTVGLFLISIVASSLAGAVTGAILSRRRHP
jgi:hypothetical protein